MNRRIRFFALLLIVVSTFVLGINSESGLSYGWLCVSLVAAFAASEGRYWWWRRSRR